jgi:benzoyl-CoA reductase/2-hydroxyglutaryl-CoA dehydratase subunit BcrC/BadD/HgdB
MTALAEPVRFETQYDYIDYSKNVQHSYSPAVGRLLDMVKDYIQYAEQQAEHGHQACYTPGIWDAPLIYGCDTIPVSHTELGRLGSRQAMTISENHFLLPKEACSMVNCLIGGWYLRRNGSIRKILFYTSQCEAVEMGIELIKSEGYDVHISEGIYSSKYTDEESIEEKIRFLTRESRRIGEFLLDGKPIDEDKVSERIKQANRILDRIGSIMEKRLEKPLYVKSLATMYLLAGTGHYYGRPEEFEQVVTDLEDELSSDNPNFENDKNVIPLVWVGGRGQEFGIYHAIDSNGGAILGWVSPNNFHRKYREDIPPLEAVARFSYVIPNSQNASTSMIYAEVVRELDRTKAKGVVLYGYVGCVYQGPQQELLRSSLKKLGYTSLAIEGTFQVGQPTGQLLTRVSAFMEMLS